MRGKCVFLKEATRLPRNQFHSKEPLVLEMAKRLEHSFGNVGPIKYNIGDCIKNWCSWDCMVYMVWTHDQLCKLRQKTFDTLLCHWQTFGETESCKLSDRSCWSLKPFFLYLPGQNLECCLVLSPTFPCLSHQAQRRQAKRNRRHQKLQPHAYGTVSWISC